MGSQKLGGGALLGFTPFGGPHPPIGPMLRIALSILRKMVLFGGNRPPFGGDMEVLILEFLRNLAYFCSELCRQIFDFLTAFDSHEGALTMLKIS